VNVDYAKLELKLRRNIERRLEEGWNVQPWSQFNEKSMGCRFFADGNNCCAIMASDPELGHSDSSDYVERAADALGITFEEAKSIEHGFENYADAQYFGDNELVDIGARICRHYCESK
jgi:hypothetical protein